MVTISRLLFATLLTAAALPHVAESQTERRTLSGQSVGVRNLAGRMTVEATNGSDVVVEVTFRGRHADRLKLESGEWSGANTLRVIYPADDIVYSDWPNTRNSRYEGRYESRHDYWGRDSRDRGRYSIRSSGSGTEAWADIRVLVPSGKSVRVETAVGEVRATGVDADLKIDVGAARVYASNARGRLSIDAGSGSIEVRDANVADLDVDTGSGGVVLTGVTSRNCVVDTGSGSVTADNVQCESLTVDVGSGGVRLDAIRAPEVRIESGSGSVTANFSSTVRSLLIDTGSGGVTLALPENTSARVDVSTGSGSINTDFPVSITRMERRRLTGTIGSGDARIRIDTGSGSVRLRRL